MSDYLYFKAHGKEYRSVEEGNARIKEINEEIFVKGVSDGRLTEWLDIEDAMSEAVAKRNERKAEQDHLEWRVKQIRETKRQLDMLRFRLGGLREESYGYYNFRIDWIDAEGKRRISRYKTETGFLTAYLRMIEADIYVIFAE